MLLGVDCSELGAGQKEINCPRELLMPGLAVYVPEADIGPVMQEPGLRAEILMLQSTDGLVYGVNR